MTAFPFFNHEIRVANVPLRQEVDVHLVPDMEKNTMQVRVWWQGAPAHSVDLPLDGFRVRFSTAPNSTGGMSTGE